MRINDLNDWMLALAKAIENRDEHAIMELQTISSNWLQDNHSAAAQQRLCEAAFMIIEELDESNVTERLGEKMNASQHTINNMVEEIHFWQNDYNIERECVVELLAGLVLIPSNKSFTDTLGKLLQTYKESTRNVRSSETN